jgi:hypothetical protein
MRDIASEDEKICPANRLAVLLLNWPQQTTRLVEIAVIGPAVERLEPLLSAACAATAIGYPIGACSMPRHADHERAIMAIVGRPPRLTVGHQCGEVSFQCRIIELFECFGIIEFFAHRVGRYAMLMKHFDR